jgi:hypothetical protein
MNEIKVFDKKVMAAEADLEARKYGPSVKDAVVFAEKTIGAKHVDGNTSANYDRAFSSGAKALRGQNFGISPQDVAKYGSALAVPQKWADGKTMSAYDRIAAANASTTGNTLLPDWAQLWDAMRMDISIRKNANPVIRDMIYNVYNRPDASRTNKLTELLPYGLEFVKNNGTGQPVNQGDKGNGQVGTVDIDLYAAGFTWDLLAELFDKSLDMTALADAVAVAYNAKLDDNAMTPILNGDYSTVGTAKWTAADATSGLDRQELLYRTITNAFDGLAKRKDPVTGKRLNVNGAYIIASGYDARHIAQVASGLPSTNQKYLPAISGLGGVIVYDGETIQMRDKTVTYSGVTDGYAYLVIPKHRYMDIIVKQGLTAEVDMTPDVKTLAREEYAYYFAEGIFSDGVAYAVQKITLPTW